jgi:hypothetical protein
MIISNPSHTEDNPKLCGIRIKRDSLYYQYKGCGAVPQSRSKREVLILIGAWLKAFNPYQSLSTLSSLLKWLQIKTAVGPMV